MIIVVGVDDTPEAAHAARRAVELARRLDGVVHLVHVGHVQASVLAALSAVPAPVADYLAAERRAVWERMAPLTEAAGSEVRTVELEGYPPDTLVRYAEQEKADLIVVGSRGRGELASLLLGSTSHRVLQVAHCDVLVVRTEADA